MFFYEELYQKPDNCFLYFLTNIKRFETMKTYAFEWYAVVHFHLTYFRTDIYFILSTRPVYLRSNLAMYLR